MTRWTPVTRLDVWYQDDGAPRRVGGLAQARDGIHFQYDIEWLAAELELSPLGLPLALGTQVVRAPDSGKLHGLHGVFADALPDSWGLRVLAMSLRRHGLDPARAGALDRLAFMGSRAMGALSFRPAADAEDDDSHVATLDALATQADALAEGALEAAATSQALDILERAAISAGGAQPKVLIGADADGKVVAGETQAPGFTSWLVKFTPRHDGLGLRTDSGVLEEAFARMARAAGIEMPQSRLFGTSDGRRHFGVERFDRTPARGRRHVHSLAGLLGREPGEGGDYDELLRVAFALTGDARTREEVLRRLCFNIATLNDDDHLKNVAFLMEPDGQWRLAPAFDVTHSPSRHGERGMSVAGLEGDIRWSTVEALAARHSVKRSRLMAIREQVDAAVATWPQLAEAAEVPAAAITGIAARFAARRRTLDAIT